LTPFKGLKPLIIFMPNALISVYNKEGIEEFARELVSLGWKIYASGGTTKYLKETGIEVHGVAELIGSEAVLGHRVVTLSREIYAGILARDTDEDRDELRRLNIPEFHIICVDLYPLEEEIENKNSTRESVIEKTDIGGPTLLRAGAKGRRIVICEQDDRARVIEWLKNGEKDKKRFLDELASKAERVVADYALASGRYHSKGKIDGMIGEEILSCLYGENPWQAPAAMHSANTRDPLALDKFRVFKSMEPSFNNLCDIDRMLQTITHVAAAFDINRGKAPYIAIGVKHGNACGAAFGDDKQEAIKNMIRGDVKAIYGGWVMFNFSLDKELAEVLLTYKTETGKRRLLDGIVAVDFSKDAICMHRRKHDKCRFLKNKALGKLNKDSLDFYARLRYVRGGFLKQPNYTAVLNLGSKGLVKTSDLSENEENDILLGWAVGSTSNSNTITLIKDGLLIGNGVGQQDRMNCAKIAIERARLAGHDTNNAAAYSDSFFPFTDAVEILAKAGIKAIFSPSGSIGDKAVSEFCQKNNITLYQVPNKEIRGFYGH